MSAWQKLRAAFDARNRRERIVLALLAAVVVTLLWAELAWDGQRQAARRLQQERATLETRLTAADTRIAQLEKAARTDPNADLERQRRQLEAHMAELDRRLKSQMGDLIDPANMARVLEAILTRHTDLRLRRLENLPTRPLLAGEDGKAPEAGVYRHGLEMEFSGSYLSLLAYLKELDALPWNFYWDALELEVEDYPRAVITIRVHTLSLDEGWIGV